jgi:hypothetical protein
LIGIAELPGRSIQEWIRITESFISNFFSITNSTAVQDLETTIRVTGVIGVPAPVTQELQEPSFVIVLYTQEFMYRTTTDDETVVDAAYLVTMPFAEAIGRGSYSILLQDSGVAGLAAVAGMVSPVEIPAAPFQDSGGGVRG